MDQTFEGQPMPDELAGKDELVDETEDVEQLDADPVPQVPGPGPV